MKELKYKSVKSVILRLASPQEILTDSYGEVLKPETINYRTQRPERDGLFSERIFGPTKDYECYCGKYKRIRYKGIICDKCGVEVTHSSVRRERMGHINLAAPVSHIWFLKSPPSNIALFLDVSLPALERVVYYSAYIITKVNEQAKNKLLQDLEREFSQKSKTAKTSQEKKALTDNFSRTKKEIEAVMPARIISDVEYYNLSKKYGPIFEADLGAEPVMKFLEQIDLRLMEKNLQSELKQTTSQNRKKILKRLRLVNLFGRNKRRPEWMFLTALPVIPPDLRPMVPLDGGRYATSDVNDLYRRIINRNNRLKKLIELKAPQVILKNEKRMLQEAVDALIDNTARKGQSQVRASTGQKRPLRSLADMLRGKQGRFRQNLLGKRVDYSGRSVIVVGPELRLHECGLPKRMALELFKPFVIRELLKREIVYNIKQANRLVERPTAEVWAILEGIIKDRYVLLNRAPTLHRLGIQAFKPVLVEGLAIRIPPMVCTAFNADFDGDQMAVHLPLTDEAQKEARELMLSARNLLKPATGEALARPTQDIVLGCYYLTSLAQNNKGESKIFYDEAEAVLAYDYGQIGLRDEIKVKRLKGKNQEMKTSVGRIIFNQVLPHDFEFINEKSTSKVLTNLIGKILYQYGPERGALVLDSLKNLGFRYATISGFSIAASDIVVPQEKSKLVAQAEKRQDQVEEEFENGFLSEREKAQKIYEIWSETKMNLQELIIDFKKSHPENSVGIFIDSGARGNWTQLGQMAGMKGLVENPKGEVIELPIKSSFKEGFSVLEYFVSTHGSRKGMADTALKTAAAGYLTRRMVDVAQDVIVRREDCGDDKGIEIIAKDGEEINEEFSSRLFSRVSLEEVKDHSGKIIVKKGDYLDAQAAQAIQDLSLAKLRVRSPLTCKVIFGVCAKCYGYDLGHNKPVDLGQAVGIVAAQSIGEPGTQLTMRTFHTGGVAAGGDITHGLPRVDEIFEMRLPKNQAQLSQYQGKILDIKEEEGKKIIKIKLRKSSKKQDTVEVLVPLNQTTLVKIGDEIKKGTQLTEGSLNPADIFKYQGKEETIRYIINEVKKIYNFQGSHIHDKHVEIIVRKMLSRVRITEPGDSDFIIGDIIEKDVFFETNRHLRKQGKNPAKARQLILGITKVSLTTHSFLSAASFQETARVLIKASIEGRQDKLKGLKENVIIGKKIPAGTGFELKSPLA